MAITMLSAGPIPALHLEFIYKNNTIQASCDERISGEVRTIRPYDEIDISMQHINSRCAELVDVLNSANRDGEMTAHVLERLQRIGQLFYDELFPIQIKQALKHTQTRYMRLSLDEHLVQIPWELLNDGEHYLCRRFYVGRLIRTRHYLPGMQNRKCRPPLDMLILADPEGNLKGALSECKSLRQFMDSNYRLISAAMHNNRIGHRMVVENLRQYDFIHFAGHAKYNAKEPDQSGWQLSDGMFNANDIARMAGSANMPAFIFSNACQSARIGSLEVDGQFEENISGFANSFLLTGVRHYLGTSWDIMDETAGAYAHSFYQHLFTGAPIGKAVQLARNDLADSRSENFINWASYVLYGDPTFCYFPQVEEKDEAAEYKTFRSAGAGEPENAVSSEDVFNFAERPAAVPRKSFSRIIGLAVAVVVMIASVWLWSRPDKSYLDLETKAAASFQAGDFLTAKTICGILEDNYPNRPLSTVLLGKIHLTEGNLNHARHLFEAVLTKDEQSTADTSDALTGLGRIASIQSKGREAVDYYQKAHQANTDNWAAVLSQAVIMEKNKDYSNALNKMAAVLPVADGPIGLQHLLEDLRYKATLKNDSEKQRRIRQMVRDLAEKYRQRKLNVVAADDPWTSRPLTIWLTDFKISGYGLNESQPRIVTSALIHRMQQQTRVRFVEREMIEALLAEMDIGISGLTDKGVMLRLGRMMAARIIIACEIMYSGPEILVALRITEVETSRIIDTISELFNHNTRTDRIVNRLTEMLKRSLLHAFPLKGRIVSLEESRVKINIGETAGVENGDHFTTPHTGTLLKISDVETAISYAQCIQGDIDSLKQDMKVEIKRP